MPASTGPLHAPNFRLLFASSAVSYFGTASMTFPPLGHAIAGWVGAGIGNSTYLLVGAIWIVVTTVIAGCATSEGDPGVYRGEAVTTLEAAHSSVETVRDFRLRPSLREPDLAASVPAS